MAKRYMDYARNFWGLDEFEAAECAITGQPTNEWHHLQPRGMGGSRYKDTPINLVPVTREVHNKAEGNPRYNRTLTEVHIRNLITHIASYHNFNIEFELTDVLQENTDRRGLSPS